MKVGIFTSSTPIGAISPNRAQRAIEFLKSKGHEIVLGEMFYQNDFYRTGTILERANEINELAKEKIDLLLSSIGGNNTSSILPYLNYELINQNVKTVCGFSDSTALLSAIINKCPDVEVFYGPALFPNFGEFEQDSREISYNSLFNYPHQISYEDFIYDSEENWEHYEQSRQLKSLVWKSKNINKDTTLISGVVKGGNLSTLSGIWGSEYAPIFNQGDILFIEDEDKNIATMERLFNLLKLNKTFDHLNAIILGTHKNFDDQKTGKQPIDVLLEVLNGQNIPILYDVNISHDKPMLAIRLNSLITIDFVQNKIINKWI
ncbi:hypothetical protein ELUMI_v1c02970 [Williamsoniiplasma luminosum]|uniref:LD-carboxypeptidase n=1 Tax=Williamsoniiplasma luminosum TaxID=214888 RepID=A0A2K8NT57_9MOLU|nr:S66 peptidase family protein [Williamsoniiplasma luminosum]ATZ17022.1 hypothetical protein ELUMI_v1c02970 [Williamsoniiplasma luminosum]